MIRRLQTYAWEGRHLLHGLFDLVRWPFERLIWGIERAVIWPLRERVTGPSTPTRGIAMGSAGLLVAGALAFAAIQATDGEEAESVAVAPVSAPIERPTPADTRQPAEPVLQGTKPDFSPQASDSAAKVADAETVISSDPDATIESTTSSSTPTASDSAATGEVKDPGPAAIDVARRFSGAFVLYETGSTNPKVRKAFAATATPQLTKALLRRPPRLPAKVEVPKAKVLNVVPGPRSGDTFTLSASLLRVGVTSELRIDVQREKESGEWRVTDVLG
ncbi:MAG TPA: hypothetical protein VN752_11340 [Solirubrobacterales bacterium]|nr:hypothetical protein [Solirubrobacterales bacterium]